MNFTLPERFSLSVPARKVVLLPDALFFCRTVPVAEVAEGADVTAQVNLALEALSPFPAAQLYQGYYWRTGAKHACVFAAYRKRFSPEEVEEWGDAEGVIPTFAAMLSLEVERPTTLLLSFEQGYTAVNWDDPADVPTSVITRTLIPDGSGPDRGMLREEVLRESGGGRTVLAIETAPVLEPGTSGDTFVFRAETSTSFTRDELDQLDVRDKDELSARRRARVRDVYLWRGFAGCAAALALFGILELALIGGGVWQKARLTVVDRLTSPVAEIRTADNLTRQVNERSTNRMRPFEMLELLTEKKPASVVFVSATATSLYTIDILARTNTLNDASAYRSALVGLDACEKVEIRPHASRDGTSTFNLLVTFKPDAFKGGPQS